MGNSSISLPIDTKTECTLICCANESEKLFLDPLTLEPEQGTEERTNLCPGDVFLGKITPEGIAVVERFDDLNEYPLIPYQKVSNNEKIKPQFLKINHPKLSDSTLKNKKESVVQLFKKLTPLDVNLIEVILCYLSDEIILLQITSTLHRDYKNITQFTKPWIEDEDTAKLYLKLLTLQNIYPFQKDMKNRTKFDKNKLSTYAIETLKSNDLNTYYDTNNATGELCRIIEELHTFNDFIPENDCNKIKYKMDLYLLPNDCSFNKPDKETVENKNDSNRNRSLSYTEETIEFNVSKDSPFCREYLTNEAVLIATKIDNNLDNILKRNEVEGSRWFNVEFDKNCINKKAMRKLKIKSDKLTLGIGGYVGYGSSRSYLQLSVSEEYLPVAILSVT